MKVSRIAILALALIVSAPAFAALEAGEKELTASFSYSKSELDDVDFEITAATLSVDLGYLFTANHEIGGRLSWFKFETDTGFGSSDSDGTAFGAFYHFNFGAAGSATPFVGAFYTIIGGDEGDIVDSEYGLEGGVKIYPWENGGFILKAAWAQATGADNNPDGDGIGLFAGIGLKWQ